MTPDGTPIIRVQASALGFALSGLGKLTRKLREAERPPDRHGSAVAFSLRGDAGANVARQKERPPVRPGALGREAAGLV